MADPREVAAAIIQRSGGVVLDSELVVYFIDQYGTAAFEALSDTAWRDMAKQIRDAVAAATITARWPGESEPLAYIVARDGGSGYLEIADCGSYATQQGAREEVLQHGDGWATYAVYPVPSKEASHG